MRVDVWSDFVCPWCFLASTSLERLVASHGVEVHWHAYELRPKGAPPISPEYRQHIETVRPRMEAMALKDYGVQIRSGAFGIDSRPALIGAKYAEQQGQGAAYHRAVFAAYWMQAENIGDEDVLVRLAAGVELEAAAFRAALTKPELEMEVDTDIQAARAFQITGVPAMIFANKYLVPGAQPYDELDRLISYIRQREGDANG